MKIKIIKSLSNLPASLPDSPTHAEHLGGCSEKIISAMNTVPGQENKKVPKPPSPHLLRGCLLILSEQALEMTVLVHVHFGKSSYSHMNWPNIHFKTILVIMDLITGLGVCKTLSFGKQS